MNLISREAAIKFAKEQMAKETGAYSRGRNAALLVMKSALDNPDAIPSAPAVPLDMLCEWLEVNARTPIYNLQHTAEWWKESLTMWMEEENHAEK